MSFYIFIDKIMMQSGASNPSGASDHRVQQGDGGVGDQNGEDQDDREEGGGGYYSLLGGR